MQLQNPHTQQVMKMARLAPLTIALAALVACGAGDGTSSSGSSSSSSSSSSTSSSSSSSSSSSNSSSSSSNSSSGSNGGGSAQKTITIQENETGFCGVEGIIESIHSGYRGEGYANADNESGTKVIWSVDSNTGQNVSIQIRYANGGGSNRDAALSVAGASQSDASFQDTGGWANWKTETINAVLQPGNNTITLVGTTAGGSANVDSITLVGDGISPAECSADSSNGGSNSGGSNNNGDPGNGSCGSGSPHAVVTGSPGSYKMNGQNFGNDYGKAVLAAIDSLSSGRNQQERVSVMASGDVGTTRINIPSNTIFEVCGTMKVGVAANRGSISIWGKHTENISIPYLKMTGKPYAAMLIANTDNLHLGKIDLRLSGGLGIRFDNRDSSNNIRIDDVYVEGTSGHGLETWNIDGLTIGKVTVRDTGYAGLLLNNTVNAKIGTVDGKNTGSGTGYATMRFANTNGRINGKWPTNIYVDKVISRGGGRGIFCVSNSGGVSINSIDLADNGNNAMLIENCHNFTIKGGKIKGGGEVRISARSEFPNTSDVTISNVKVSGTDVKESPCGKNIRWDNVSVSGGKKNTCN